MPAPRRTFTGCSDRIGPICVHAWQRQHNGGDYGDATLYATSSTKMTGPRSYDRDTSKKNHTGGFPFLWPRAAPFVPWDATLSSGTGRSTTFTGTVYISFLSGSFGGSKRYQIYSRPTFSPLFGDGWKILIEGTIVRWRCVSLTFLTSFTLQQCNSRRQMYEVIRKHLQILS